MKVGDLVKFRETNAIGSIIDISNEGFVELYVTDGTLDNTPSANGFTGMTMSMIERTAEVISEGR